MTNGRARGKPLYMAMLILREFIRSNYNNIEFIYPFEHYCKDINTMYILLYTKHTNNNKAKIEHYKLFNKVLNLA